MRRRTVIAAGLASGATALLPVPAARADTREHRSSRAIPRRVRARRPPYRHPGAVDHVPAGRRAALPRRPGRSPGTSSRTPARRPRRRWVPARADHESRHAHGQPHLRAGALHYRRPPAQPARRGLHPHAARGDRRASSHPLPTVRTSRHHRGPATVGTAARARYRQRVRAAVDRLRAPVLRGPRRDSPYVTTAAPGFAGTPSTGCSPRARSSRPVRTRSDRTRRGQRTAGDHPHPAAWRHHPGERRATACPGCARMATGSPSTATGPRSAGSRWASPASPCRTNGGRTWARYVDVACVDGRGLVLGRRCSSLNPSRCPRRSAGLWTRPGTVLRQRGQSRAGGPSGPEPRVFPRDPLVRAAQRSEPQSR